MDKQTLLKQYFGHSTFRPGQETLIDALLEGRDVLGVMPTGAGKSVCYQIPAMMLPGITLIISPLISLMKDQVTALTQAGIPAAYLNSSLTPRQYDAVYAGARAGQYKMIYVAPERLDAPDFLAFANTIQISLVAVDEAHCVSQWGQDFRPSYLRISDFVEGLVQRPTVGAFTATATDVVRGDIEKLLGLRKPVRLVTGFDRPNLYFEVVEPKSKDLYLQAFLKERRDQSGIVYCATRKAVEKVCEMLVAHGVPATKYHAGLSAEMRRRNQEDFVYDTARVMVATNAFGMGIDKSNVSFVVHYNMPKNIESYYQEAGRAGRDGSPARCVLLFSNADVQTARFLLNNMQENEALSEEERETVHRQDLHRLNQMVRYCKTTGCLRAFLLQYFGEEAPDHCDNCGNCNGIFTRREITIEAQKILSGVTRVERRMSGGLGQVALIQMLQGSTSKRVQQLGLDELPTYGVLATARRNSVREWIDSLIDQGYLVQTDGEYPVLHTTDKAKQVLFHGEKVWQIRRKQSAGEPVRRSRGGNAPSISMQGYDDLYEALRTLRSSLAKDAHLPAYMIFSNAALTDMVAKRPHNMAEFLDVSGVGERKAQQYGQVFLQAIREWESTDHATPEPPDEEGIAPE